MKLLEKINLLYRAYKYKYKDDRGGIDYITKNIQNGQTVIDIGAHKGGYLYFMAQRVGKSGKVYAFEPQSNLYQYLERLIRLFQWKHVSIEHLALSDSKGEVTLYIPTNKVSSASSPGATIVPQKGNSEVGKTETVKTETLDAYCTKNSIEPDFLKIDVEGNELKIFNGGDSILKKFKPKIIVEIESRHVGEEKVLETFNYLDNLGYKGHFIHGVHLIPLKDFRFEIHQNRGDMANYCNNFTFE